MLNKFVTSAIYYLVTISCLLLHEKPEEISLACKFALVGLCQMLVRITSRKAQNPNQVYCFQGAIVGPMLLRNERPALIILLLRYSLP